MANFKLKSTLLGTLSQQSQQLPFLLATTAKRLGFYKNARRQML